MSVNSLSDTEYLRQCFEYNRDTGMLIWKRRPLSHFKGEKARRAWNTRFSGTEAGYDRVAKNGDVRRSIGFGGKMYMAHRIIFALVYGRDPGECIDHIDRNSLNNRIENLREVPYSINSMNGVAARKGSKAGLRGVSWCERDSLWRAGIRVNGKLITLGEYRDKHEAHQAYLAVKDKYHAGAVLV